MHDTTTIVSAYSIYKTDSLEIDSWNIVFVDLMHSSMQISR